jgi:hypothetical protein
MMKTLVIKVDNGVTYILTENSSYKGLCGTVLVQSLTTILASCPLSNNGIGKLALYKADETMTQVAEWNGDPNDKKAG